MRYRFELLVLLLLTSVFLLVFRERFPHLFHYVVMGGVLVGTRQLMPEWFEATWLRGLWLATVIGVGVGLALELLTTFGLG